MDLFVPALYDRVLLQLQWSSAGSGRTIFTSSTFFFCIVGIMQQSQMINLTAVS